jgi:hypothetical protein
VDKTPRNIKSPRRGLVCGTGEICLQLYCEIKQNCKRTWEEWVASLKADICELRKTGRVLEKGNTLCPGKGNVRHIGLPLNAS